MRWKCMSFSRCDTFLLLTQQTIRVAASGRHGGRSQLSARSRETGNRKQEVKRGQLRCRAASPTGDQVLSQMLSRTLCRTTPESKTQGRFAAERDCSGVLSMVRKLNLLNSSVQRCKPLFTLRRALRSPLPV